MLYVAVVAASVLIKFTFTATIETSEPLATMWSPLFRCEGDPSATIMLVETFTIAEELDVTILSAITPSIELTLTAVGAGLSDVISSCK